MNVSNQSLRSVPTPRLIVIHDTESHDRAGNSDLESIGAWFNNKASQASSHVCVDGEGRSAIYVPDGKKAWHAASFNSISLGIEQIGFATFTTAVWNRNQRAQIKKVAKYIAYWSKRYNIPIREGKVSTATGAVLLPGIVTHSQLGAAGGGHHDPGKGYPMAALLRTARWYAKFGWK